MSHSSFAIGTVVTLSPKGREVHRMHYGTGVVVVDGDPRYSDAISPWCYVQWDNDQLNQHQDHLPLRCKGHYDKFLEPVEDLPTSLRDYLQKELTT